MAMVLVGATIVASIETVWAGTVSHLRVKTFSTGRMKKTVKQQFSLKKVLRYAASSYFVIVVCFEKT